MLRLGQDQLDALVDRVALRIKRYLAERGNPRAYLYKAGFFNTTGQVALAIPANPRRETLVLSVFQNFNVILGVNANDPNSMGISLSPSASPMTLTETDHHGLQRIDLYASSPSGASRVNWLEVIRQ